MTNKKIIASVLLSAGIIASTSAARPNLRVYADPQVMSIETLAENDISGCNVIYNPEAVYNGSEIKPMVIINLGDKVLSENTDYILSYSDNIYPGEGQITVTGIGEYTGVKELVFEIKKANISFDFTVSATETSVTLKPKNQSYDYKVYTTDANGDNEQFKTNVTKGQSYTYSGQTSGSSVFFKIYPVVNGIEVGEPVSIPASTLPSKLTGLATTSTADSIKLNWTAVKNATGYRVYRHNGYGYQLIGTTNSTSYVDKNIQPGIEYKYRVSAIINTCGKTYEGSGANISSITEIKPVTMKSDFTATISAVRINWEKSEDVDGYIVKRYNPASKQWAIKATLSNPDITTYRDSGLKTNTEYYYRVQAFKMVSGKMVTGTEGTDFRTSTKPGTVNLYTSYSTSKNSIRLKWETIPDATGYEVYSGSTKIGTVKENVGEYKIKNLGSGKTYQYKVRAYKKIDDVTLRGAFSPVNSYTTVSEDRLYSIGYGSAYYNTSKQWLGNISGWYTGYKTPKYSGYVVINVKGQNVLVKESNVSVRTNVKALQTACIGQYGGSIAGYAACGPAAAAILVNSEKGLNWSKDNLILYSERNCLNDQGSLRGSGGMTAPKLVNLINWYSGGLVKAKNIYGSNSTDILKSQIDKGHRSIVVVRYSSYVDTYSYATHFLVVCGYEYINGQLYFYYADPYYGGGNRALNRVDASTLRISMSSVTFKEPACIIVLE